MEVNLHSFVSVWFQSEWNIQAQFKVSFSLKFEGELKSSKLNVFPFSERLRTIESSFFEICRDFNSSRSKTDEMDSF
jgi:hypothetical protein